MSQMFMQMFATFTLIFSAISRFASALNHIGVVADESAALYSDEARANRSIRAAALKKDVEKAEGTKAVK